LAWLLLVLMVFVFVFVVVVVVQHSCSVALVGACWRRRVPLPSVGRGGFR